MKAAGRVRAGLKAAAASLLVRSPWGAARRRARRGATLILAYHNIVPDGAGPVGDRPLHLPLGEFAAQLDHLQRNYSIVSLEEALRPPPAGARARVAITFDDAYAGALTLGLPLLARRGLPATVFVAPGLLGCMATWWDALGAASPGGMRPVQRSEALGACQGLLPCVALHAQTSQWPWAAFVEHARIATVDELASAAALSGVTLGPHTWDHPNLAALGAPEREPQFRRPLAWLRERFANVVPVLALPYGLGAELTPEALHAGHLRVLLVDGGWMRSYDGAVVPRTNVPAGVTGDVFSWWVLAA